MLSEVVTADVAVAGVAGYCFQLAASVIVFM